MTGFGKIRLNYSTSTLHGALGCRPPNLEAVAQAVFALCTTTLQYFAKLIIADFEEKKRRVKALLRSGGMPCIRILLLRVSGTLQSLQLRHKLELTGVYPFPP